MYVCGNRISFSGIWNRQFVEQAFWFIFWHCSKLASRRFSRTAKSKTSHSKPITIEIPAKGGNSFFCLLIIIIIIIEFCFYFLLFDVAFCYPFESFIFFYTPTSIPFIFLLSTSLSPLSQNTLPGLLFSRTTYAYLWKIHFQEKFEKKKKRREIFYSLVTIEDPFFP